MTHGITISFGKHKGELYTRLPVSYLRWILNQTSNNPTISVAKQLAAEELARRGTDVDIGIEITAHALDRCSLRCLDLYLRKRKRDEGLHTWMARMAKRALESAGLDQPARIAYHGVIWVFDYGECYPTVKTVFRNENNKQGKTPEKMNDPDSFL